jgi:hypothetical protein
MRGCLYLSSADAACCVRLWVLVHYHSALPCMSERFGFDCCFPRIQQASNPEDQAEVDANRAATLLNLAAAHMGLQEWGAAVARCNAALALRPGDAKALLRRAKANVGRHEYEVRWLLAHCGVGDWCFDGGQVRVPSLGW